MLSPMRFPVISPALVLLILALGLALLPLLGTSDYILSFFFLLFLYATLATSWNILGGFAGYLSLGHAAFFGLGAYGTSLLLLNFGWSPVLTTLPVAVLVGGFAGLIGYPILGLRGPAFALVTFMLTMILRLLVTNVKWTRGSTGLWLPFPPFDVWTNRVIFYETMLLVLLAMLLVAWAIQHSSFGLGLAMLRSDEEAAQAMGVPTMLLKTSAFVLSAVFAALAGGIFAYYRTYIQPSTVFDLFISITTVLMAVLGGRQWWFGPLVGAVILSSLGEVLTLTLGAQSARIAFGILLMLVIILAPDGVCGLVDTWLQQRRSPASPQ